MKNRCDFFERRLLGFAKFFSNPVSLLGLLLLLAISCESNSKEANIEEILLKDSDFQEFVMATRQLQDLWLEGSVRNPGIKSIDIDRSNAAYKKSTTTGEKIKALEDAGYTGNLSKQVELIEKAEALRARFKQKFPQIPPQSFAKALKIKLEELGSPDYTKFLKLYNHEK